MRIQYLEMVVLLFSRVVERTTVGQADSSAKFETDVGCLTIFGAQTDRTASENTGEWNVYQTKYSKCISIASEISKWQSFFGIGIRVKEKGAGISIVIFS